MSPKPIRTFRCCHGALHLLKPTLLDDSDPEKINCATFLQLVELMCHVTHTKPYVHRTPTPERAQHHLMQMSVTLAGNRLLTSEVVCHLGITRGFW